MNMNLSKLWELVEDRGVWCATVHGVAVRYGLVTEQQYVCVHIYNVHTYVYINNVTYVNNIREKIENEYEYIICNIYNIYINDFYRCIGGQNWGMEETVYRAACSFSFRRPSNNLHKFHTVEMPWVLNVPCKSTSKCYM